MLKYPPDHFTFLKQNRLLNSNSDQRLFSGFCSIIFSKKLNNFSATKMRVILFFIWGFTVVR